MRVTLGGLWGRAEPFLHPHCPRLPCALCGEEGGHIECP